MSYLNAKHQEEWLKSAVDPQIIELNVKSLDGNTPLEYLLYALPQSDRRNDGRLRDKYLKQYAHTQAGGWWVSGLDPLNDWRPMEWGRFKPDEPRKGWDKETQQATEKAVKYESPCKVPNRITCLRIPLHIWKAVADNYLLDLPENVVVTDLGEASGFWEWLKIHPEIPVILTEGEKKAACLLSLGFVAVGLSGIWGGRVGKGEMEQMHPDLAPLAQKGRKFITLFDYETKPKTRLNVYQATCRLGWAINRQGGLAEVATLPGPEKGVDDWVMALGKNAHSSVSALLDDSRTLSEYKACFRLHRERGFCKYKPNIRVKERYLTDVVPRLPDSGLVGIGSDMGTAKTELMARWRKEHPKKTFLNNGHRVNLLKNLAERLRTTMYSAVSGQDLGQIKHLSITIDSLYKLANNIQAYGCVFIDEACQYLAHLLKSKTCRSHRAEILEVLEAVIYRAKLVVLADAHLDDLTIDFFRAMRPAGEQPFIIQNDWKSGGRQVYWYEGSNSSELVSQVHAQVLAGKKVIIVSDSKRFIKKLERSLRMLDDEGRQEDDSLEPEQDRRLRVWSVHSENSGSEENSVFIREINDAVTTIDVLLASPSLGTGVDISTPHFDVIFGAFHAVSQGATECAQQLWRNRSNVPMHIWVAPRPPFGYQETNPRRIRQKYLEKNELTAFLIRIDRETGTRGAEKDWALEASCQLEAQRNWSINNLRQDLRFLLEEMGNEIIPMGDSVNQQIKERMKTVGQALDREHCESVANSKDIDQETYRARQSKDYLSREETLECEKFRIGDFYGMEVTPDLVQRDDGGRYARKILVLEATLAPPGEVIQDGQGREIVTPPQLVVDRDRYERDTLGICTDWSNDSSSWLMRNQLGLRDILLQMIGGEEVNNTSEQLLTLAERAQRYQPHIKQLLNLTIPHDMPPTWVLGQLLQQVGLSTVSRRLGSRGNRVRSYTLNPDDLEFAQQVLSYRQRRREDKERKIKLDQEIADRRAAGIASQYGFHAPPPTVSNTPPFTREESFWGGFGHEENQEQIPSENQQQPEQIPSKGTSEWVVKYTNSVREAFKHGVEAVKSLLGSLAHECMWEVALCWEEQNLQEFSQFAEVSPDWLQWGLV